MKLNFQRAMILDRNFKGSNEIRVTTALSIRSDCIMSYYDYRYRLLMRSARYSAVYRMDTFINFLIVAQIRYNNNNHDDDDDDIDHITTTIMYFFFFINFLTLCK